MQVEIIRLYGSMEIAPRGRPHQHRCNAGRERARGAPGSRCNQLMADCEQGGHEALPWARLLSHGAHGGGEPRQITADVGESPRHGSLAL